MRTGAHFARKRARGFTLIEALVALAIIAAVLSSIGAVIGTTAKGTRTIGQRLALTGAAETVFAALPARNALKPGRQSGELAGHRWRIDVTPLNVADDGGLAGALRAACGQHADAGPGRAGDPGHHGASRAQGRRMSGRRIQRHAAIEAR